MKLEGYGEDIPIWGIILLFPVVAIPLTLWFLLGLINKIERMFK